MKLFESEISLEDAERVVKAHHAAEAAKRAEALRRFIGRFFRTKETLNFLTVFTESSDSWSYAMSTAVVGGDYPTLSGLVFRRTRSGVWIETDAHITTDRGDWIEIDADEFWGAAKSIQSEMSAFLTRPNTKVV